MKVTPKEKASGELLPENLRQAIQTFEDSGFVVLEDAFDSEFISDVRSNYDAMLAENLESRGGLDALEGKTFGKNHVGFHPPLLFPLADERIVAPALAVQVMNELLGKEFQCGFYNTNTAMPGSHIQPIHRDTSPLFGSKLSVPHPVAALVLNIPLCDFTLENGSTEVWPGTHLLVDDGRDNDPQFEVRAKYLPSMRPELKACSLVLRDLRMWHRGMPNTANYPRTMLALVFSRGFIRTATLEIPRSTWEAWGKSARHIFRNNRVVEDAEAGNVNNP